jgi:hypothetical protein
VADFLAGMTDRYALLEHQRFFGGPRGFEIIGGLQRFNLDCRGGISV